HCIGVDPYYLTHKAEAVGHHPQIILSGRRVNDGMGQYVADQMVKALIDRQIHAKGARVLIMGLTFKENCPDMRNTRVVDVRKSLLDGGLEVDVFDPWVSPDEVRHEYGFDVIGAPQPGTYDGIILAVAHEDFRKQGAAAFRKLGKPDHVLYDLKYLFTADQTDARL
uniref:UDP binding domain-containing protein n=1 Tax=Brevundimonas sp. TaxID=1871086 RepID=UPI0035169E69